MGFVLWFIAGLLSFIVFLIILKFSTFEISEYDIVPMLILHVMLGLISFVIVIAFGIIVLFQRLFECKTTQDLVAKIIKWVNTK